ncbi:glutamate-5-semialdehyde dehydrogenase [Silvanigrella paludirubra]|uniref:Gamma-glutamyl phosphate reductase n=1 Tax=Silvanigrella paludirubra TaxID=2499159 RepID=A0A6N6VQH9_9BACT|nr:glutamate-5-semialdehyde dehydrogenase [Silvanigrella paludirubra]KAB8036902.1 glutamate-5-semialdehyde dehydrogenase [Silvanigrella paludirubra]
MYELKNQFQKTKKSSYVLNNLSDPIKNEVLKTLSKNLIVMHQTILIENAKDLEKMSKENPLYDRLLLTKDRVLSFANDILKIVKLKSPVQKILNEKILENGLKLQKITVPLGVIGIIYEARPNVTIDVFTLCFKSGNAVILKGGKEAHYSNSILYEIIKKTLIEHHINSDIVYLLPPEREATEFLIQAVGLVDVVIPRGSKQLIDYVRNHSKVPVIETGAGIVHTYFDSSGDLEKGRRIIENAKTRRVSVCNALDTLIIHKNRLNDLYDLIKDLSLKNVEIFADELSYNKLIEKYPDQLLNKAKEEDFGTEFLSLKMSIKTVNSIEEAFEHIFQYSSGHSEAIIAEDENAIQSFFQNIDAAAVYANAPTSFTDGGEFEMGSEIGISTQKLHARGPMGLEELTSYKWLITGNGEQIRK